MKHLLIGAAVPALALGLAAPGMAATAYMDGLFNIGPGWSTITAPGGQQCRQGCTEVRYDYITDASARRAAGAWMDANNTPDSVLFVYSLSSVGAVDARAARPDWQGTIVALGSPARPDNGRSYPEGGRPTLDVDGGAVDFVTVTGDSVTQNGGGSFSTHLNDYRNRDFSTETPVAVEEPTDAVTDFEYAPRTYAQRVADAREARAERLEARREARAERVAAYKERVAELREARAQRWSTFVSKLRGEDTDAGRAAPVDSDEASPSGSATAAERPASANSAGGDE